MELDTKLLEELNPSSSRPILHLYDWEAPCATYGHFIDPTVHLSADVFTGDYLQLAKRPTGGGLIFHTTDWAFSVLVPASHKAYSVNILENYAYVNHLVIEAINRFMGCQATLSLLSHEPTAIDRHSGHFCMAKPTKYDVMLNGRKVGGGAQRRTKSGFLHQGTISLMMPSKDFLERTLLPGTGVYQAMVDHTCVLLNGECTLKDLIEARRCLQEAFRTVIQES